MTLNIQLAKFKFHQYQTRAILLNFMLTKVTHYTVIIIWTPKLNFNMNLLILLANINYTTTNINYTLLTEHSRVWVTPLLNK